MKVKMLRTVPGANDGITSALYKEGQVYDISERLARNFFVMGAAEKAGVIETVKNMGAAPLNKMMKADDKKDKKKKDEEE